VTESKTKPKQSQTKPISLNAQMNIKPFNTRKYAKKEFSACEKTKPIKANSGDFVIIQIYLGLLYFFQINIDFSVIYANIYDYGKKIIINIMSLLRISHADRSYDLYDMRR